MDIASAGWTEGENGDEGEEEGGTKRMDGLGDNGYGIVQGGCLKGVGSWGKNRIVRGGGTKALFDAGTFWELAGWGCVDG